MLPSLLADKLHNPDHTLYSVTISGVPEGTLAPEERAAPSSSPGPSSTPAPAVQAASTHVPPSEEEIRHAIPHANAYYCKKENGWVLLSWAHKPTSQLPPLSKSFSLALASSQNNLEETDNPCFLPDPEGRKKPHFCGLPPGEPSMDDRASMTHHFHAYKDAVDASKMNTPYHRSSWEAHDATEDSNEGELLDLYVCCQCPFYLVESKVIPGVIPNDLLQALLQDKLDNPPVGKTGPAAVATALETMMTIIHNRLFTGNSRLLLLTRPKFVNALGLNENVLSIFRSLDFEHEKTSTGGDTLRSPFTDPINPEGKTSRAKLLRAWIELGAWLNEHFTQNAAKLADFPARKLYVKTSAEREEIQMAIGSHITQMERWNLPATARDAVSAAWLEQLGLTKSTYAPEFLAYGYLTQCRCDPANTMSYFSSLVNVADALGAACNVDIQTLVMEERDRSRPTYTEFEEATLALGFSTHGNSLLGIPYTADIEDEFIKNAWMEVIKRSWRELDSSVASRQQKEAMDALRLVAEFRGSSWLRGVWEKGSRSIMSPEKAYETLEVPMDVDEAMLVIVYEMRLQESPLQREKWADALSVVAETRDSERLRQLVATGSDPGDIPVIIRQDLPRGLHQLGNTCYLNSLLQYFYTITDLREAVSKVHGLDPLKDLEDDKLTDEDIKSHRVGGRLVTRREIVRSRKFVSHLADLFFKMENSDDPAIVPSIDLAKLALVTSRDEEEDEADRGGTDSSNDTDATLVDDAPPRFQSQGPSQPAEQTDDNRMGDGSAMDLDDANSSYPSKRVDSPPTSSPQAGSSFSIDRDGGDTPPPPLEPVDQDVEMQPAMSSNKRTSLIRRPTESGSVMMFGKQHDVSECMDNCMFQIETALLKFDALSGHQQDPEKTSIIKRLFYGKLRQRVSANQVEDSKSRASVHEKEDLFSHLPVNVTNNGSDLYDGLSGYFDDAVEFEGKKARMEVTLVELPPILQIQLQRVQFNRDTLQAYKSQAYVKFGETIYMDRFLDDTNPEKKAHAKKLQHELMRCRDRLRLLTEEKPVTYHSALTDTCNFLSKFELSNEDMDDETISELLAEPPLIEDEISSLRTEEASLKAELELLWADDKQAEYELTSVFIHRGSSPSFGHYFFYSRHLPSNPDSWFKYNDSEVTEVTKQEVLADTTGSTANPYLLVFCRKGMGIVDTVKRLDVSTPIS